MVQHLAEECNADIEEPGRYKTTCGEIRWAPPLFIASMANRRDVVQYLVWRGAKVNATSSTGDTSLMIASLLGNKKVVKYLVEHGADVNQTNSRGETCLMHSVQSLELVQYLIGNGANINAQDNDGCTALHRAIFNEFSYVVFFSGGAWSRYQPDDKGRFHGLGSCHRLQITFCRSVSGESWKQYHGE